VVYVFTHDSVGVGEDGPTHQPVETVSGLRLIPNLDVMRPADAEECAAAFAAAFARAGGPTLLALSRQDLPHLTAKGCVDGAARRAGTLRGGYILKRETAALEAIVLATGSEVQHAVDAATGKPGVRVVSVPCMERFLRQDQVYRDEVLPPTTKKRVAIEAGVTPLWWRFVGDAGVVLGIDRFGMSAPGNVVMAELGMTKEAVARALG
jgi:transketolase